MNARRCIFAFTEPRVDLPGYLSLNHEPDGRVTMAVRARGGDHATSVDLPPEAVRGLATTLAVELLTKPGA